MVQSTPLPGAPVYTRRQIWLVYSGLMMAMFLSALDGTALGTALVTIVTELEGARAYTWIGTAYLLTSTTCTPLFAKLSDIYGRRLLTLSAIGIFIVGSVLCGLAGTMTQLVLFRGLQGVGGGGINAMAFLVIADMISPRERGRYMGAFMSMFAVASVAGPLIGGFLTESVDWRWIFFINVPLGLVALGVCAWSLRMPRERKPASVDVPGAALLTGSISLLILAVAWASEELGWLAPPTLLMLAGALFMLGGFIWWEPRAKSPIVPMHLFDDRIIKVVLPLAAIAGGMIATASAFMPLFMQSVTGVSPTNSGLLMAPMMGGITVASILTGRRMSATGKYRSYPIAGMALAIAGMAMLVFVEDSTTGLTLGIVGMTILGASIGATMPVMSLASQNAVDQADIGAVSSMTILFRSVGSTLALAGFGALYNARIAAELDGDPRLLALRDNVRGMRNLPEPDRTTLLDAVTATVSYVFAVALVLTVAGFILAFFLEERELRTTVESADPVADLH